jgi:serine/threonine protein phosphatase PrpC
MTKQTAVEWLEEQFEESYSYINEIFKETIEQAKEMEKEQIMDACNLQRNDYKGMPTYNKSGEQYYNETYGGNK